MLCPHTSQSGQHLPRDEDILWEVVLCVEPSAASGLATSTAGQTVSSSQAASLGQDHIVWCMPAVTSQSFGHVVICAVSHDSVSDTGSEKSGPHCNYRTARLLACRTTKTLQRFQSLSLSLLCYSHWLAATAVLISPAMLSALPLFGFRELSQQCHTTLSVSWAL